MPIRLLADAKKKRIPRCIAPRNDKLWENRSRRKSAPFAQSAKSAARSEVRDRENSYGESCVAVKIRHMKRLIVAAGLLFAIGGLAFGQQAPFHDALLDQFQGKWVLQGTILGRQTAHDVDAQWVLGHQYLQIREVSREKNAQGEPDYEATVFVGWDQAKSQYLCIWVDTYGGSFASVGHAPKSGDQIPFVFKGDKSEFHTTFLYDRKADSWEWRMDSAENGALKPFARLKMTKK